MNLLKQCQLYVNVFKHLFVVYLIQSHSNWGRLVFVILREKTVEHLFIPQIFLSHVAFHGVHFACVCTIVAATKKIPQIFITSFFNKFEDFSLSVPASAYSFVLFVSMNESISKNQPKHIIYEVKCIVIALILGIFRNLFLPFHLSIKF